ncbi:lasso peptide biosynthesis B2 protein [Candidatus Margulisiibacteriota bacterium]
MKLNKLFYYRDIRLHLIILNAAHKAFPRCESNPLAALAEEEVAENIKYDPEKVKRYASIILLIRSRFGIRDTCLSSSVFLCYALRGAGQRAAIQFGAKKKKELKGHCWVDLISKSGSGYRPIFSYPQEEKDA